jgi:zinc transport system substrate-binding protein
MKRILILISLVIIGFLALFVVSRTNLPEQSPETAGKISIATSFYPLGEFAKQVGGDYVDVSVVVPPGVEPHDFEPTPQDIVKIYNAKLFIYNGGEIDPWAPRIEKSLQQQSIETMNMLAIIGKTQSNDPHIWLDPIIAQQQVNAIRDALVVIDPEHDTQYRLNAYNYNRKLAQLDTNFRAGLLTCTSHDAVTSHAAFGYLAQRYHFTQVPITGINPDEEPSAKKLSEIVQLVKDKKIQYVFFETLASPRTAELLAQEAQVKTLVFNPLEGLTPMESLQGKNYISIMQDNLKNLRLALNCR